MVLPRNVKRKTFANVVHFTEMRETYGNCVFQANESISGRTYDVCESRKKTLFSLIDKLESLSLSRNPQKYDYLQVFADLKHEVWEASRTAESSESSTSTGLSSAKWMNLFTVLGGIKSLQRLVMSFCVLPVDTAIKHETVDMLQLQGLALEVFHIICISFESVAKGLGEQEGFVGCLFSYLQFQETCFPACKLLECLLLSRTDMLRLHSIENLKELVMGFKDICLANFCKILAITLSELDMYEHKTSLYAQTKQKKGQNFYVRDKNQDVILAIPDILLRLVRIACAKPYVPYFPNVGPESEQWMQWIDLEVSQNIQNDDEEFIAGITKWSSTSLAGPPQTSVQIALELTFRADAVCVLGLLLVGRHRKEVQKKLAELRLVPRLSDLFDYFVWRSNARREYARLPGHNSACECSPEVALKIQVLRLIHSFCDHSSFKRVMLSWCEYSEITAIEDASSTPVPMRLPQKAMCVGSKGLLSKIVEVMKKENGVSTFRFWLSRAIESYLRGSITNADQDFLIRRNLLQLVVGNLISSSSRNKEVLQSSFDLLGELIKFNFSAFQELNKCLGTTARQKKLSSLMNASLVDSNMFIRSLILSYECFISSEEESVKGFAEKQCYVLSHVNSLKLRVAYLQKLLSLINIHNLTQENVSCLNTALVILMYGEERQELPQYLHCLSADEEGEGCSVATQASRTLTNLKDLLLFWKEHYLQKDKDCTILEKSSRIRFQQWRRTVSMLTRICDPPDPCTVWYYIVPTPSSRAS